MRILSPACLGCNLRSFGVPPIVYPVSCLGCNLRSFCVLPARILRILCLPSAVSFVLHRAYPVYTLFCHSSILRLICHALGLSCVSYGLLPGVFYVLHPSSSVSSVLPWVYPAYSQSSILPRAYNRSFLGPILRILRPKPGVSYILVAGRMIGYAGYFGVTCVFPRRLGFLCLTAVVTPPVGWNWQYARRILYPSLAYPVSFPWRILRIPPSGWGRFRA